MTAPTPGADDAARPRLHLTARSGWINDPIGLTHHGGRYHVFFQHVPGSAVWAPEQHWGHATSTDLVHWREEPVALSPGDGDDGVWSGGVVVPEGGRPTAFYTSADASAEHLGRVRVAWPADDAWRTWTKGPVVAGPPEGVDLAAVRDPFVTHDGDAWLMVLGAGLADGSGAALAFRSDDLARWTYDGVLASRPAAAADPWTGEIWECPQLVRVDDRWALVVSAWGGGHPGFEAYALGDLRGGRFVAERWHRLTYGPSLYAGSAFRDAAGAPGLVHWLRGVRDPGGRWAGAHSVPHRLAVVGDRLEVAPHPAVLRAATAVAGPEDGSPRSVVGACHVEWRVTDGDDGADGAERTATLALRRADHVAARLEARGPRLAVRCGDAAWEMPFAGRAVLLVDGPVLEVFAGGVVGAAALPAAPAPTTFEATAGALRVRALA